MRNMVRMSTTANAAYHAFLKAFGLKGASPLATSSVINEPALAYMSPVRTAVHQ